ncbi:uncharacterized protein LOC111637698, partial [Centruroides sculpturatus]|uniref:uncharacterized protein LOC111637698 n=1 Tax=Centruroides sculpturatus TaxID=218467 RepID=UPI000C6DE0AD
FVYHKVYIPVYLFYFIYIFQALGILIAIPGFWLILTLLAFLIFFLCRCCDGSLNKKKKLTPLKWTLAIFALLCWSMRSDVTKWTRACLQCQRSKVHRHTRSKPGTFLIPSSRFEHVHIDIVGPLPPLQGFRYIVTCIDRYSRWLECIPVTDISAESMAKVFYANWICRFGVPLRLTSDQGRQFESDLFHVLSTTLGIKQICTTPYHPAANGMVERLHRTLKAALRCHGGDDWANVLPTVLLGLRTAFKEDIQAATAEMIYGENLRLQGEFFTPSRYNPNPANFVGHLKTTMEKLRPTPTRQPNRTTCFVHEELNLCQQVFVRNDTCKFFKIEILYFNKFYEIKTAVYTNRLYYNTIRIQLILENDVNPGLDKLKEDFSKPLPNATVHDYLQDALKNMRKNVSTGITKVVDINKNIDKLDLQPIPDNIKMIEIIRWPVTIAALCVLILVCVILLWGVIRHSRCLLILFSVLGLLSVVICWISVSLYLGSCVAASDFCLNPEPFFYKQASGTFYTSVLKYYLNCDDPNPFEDSIEDGKKAVHNVQNTLAAVTKIAVTFYPQKEVREVLDSLALFLNRTEKILSGMDVLLNCNKMHKEYETAMGALCTGVLEGTAFMLVSAAGAGILFTVLIWVASHTWIHIRKKFSVLGLLSVVICWISVSLYLGSCVAASDFCLNPEPFFYKQASGTFYTSVLKYYLNCDDPNPFEDSIEDGKKAVHNVQNTLAAVTKIAVTFYPQKEVREVLDSLALFLNRTEKILSGMDVLLNCNKMHKEYETAMGALCTGVLEGTAFMLVSAAGAGILFTVLIWVASHTWIHIRKKRPAEPVDEEDPFLPSSAVGSNSRRNRDTYSSMGARPRYSHTPPQTPHFTASLNGRSGGREDQPCLQGRYTPPPATDGDLTCATKF